MIQNQVNYFGILALYSQINGVAVLFGLGLNIELLRVEFEQVLRYFIVLVFK